MACKRCSDAIRSGVITNTHRPGRSYETGGCQRLVPRPPGPAGHVAGRRRLNICMQAGTARPPVRTPAAICDRSARPCWEEHRAPRRAERRPCSRRALGSKSQFIGAGCRQGLGALDAALCSRCLCSCISANEARTASSELREAVRRAGMLVSAHMLQDIYLVGRDRL